MNERLSNTAQPSLGRFLNRDPIGFAGGLNLFSYADGNPTTFTDASGLQTGAGDPDWNPVTGQPGPNPFTTSNGVVQENVPGLVEFFAGMNPIIGAGLSIRDFKASPGLVTGAFLVLGLAGLRSLKGASSTIGMSKGPCPHGDGLTPHNFDFTEAMRSDGIPVIERPGFLGGEKYDSLSKIVYLGDTSPHAISVHEYVHAIQDRLGQIPKTLTSSSSFRLELENLKIIKENNDFFALNKADLDFLWDGASTYLPNRSVTFQRNARRRL